MHGLAARLVGACGVVALLAGCERAGPPAPATLTLFAAASTTEPVEAILASFEERTGVRVRVNFAGSSTLAQQIIAGAPADLFLSASEDWANEVTARGLAAERCDLLRNALVIVTPAASETELASPADLLRPAFERIAVADTESVPAGRYARNALQAAGLWEQVRPRLVQGANVRQALVFVERGEAQAGLVYATDAAISRHVRVAYAFDARATGPIVYPLVRLRGDGPAAAAARRLYATLRSAEARAVFEAYGFGFVESEN